jgi:hypothetical protein
MFAVAVCWPVGRIKPNGLENLCTVHHLTAVESAWNTFRRRKMLTDQRVRGRWALRFLSGRERTPEDRSGL